MGIEPTASRFYNHILCFCSATGLNNNIIIIIDCEVVRYLWAGDDLYYSDRDYRGTVAQGCDCKPDGCDILRHKIVLIRSSSLISLHALYLEVLKRVTSVSTPIKCSLVFLQNFYSLLKDNVKMFCDILIFNLFKYAE